MYESKTIQEEKVNNNQVWLKPVILATPEARN
jgi:hypothetical protein